MFLLNFSRDTQQSPWRKDKVFHIVMTYHWHAAPTPVWNACLQPTHCILFHCRRWATSDEKTVFHGNVKRRTTSFTALSAIITEQCLRWEPIVETSSWEFENVSNATLFFECCHCSVATTSVVCSNSGSSFLTRLQLGSALLVHTSFPRRSLLLLRSEAQHGAHFNDLWMRLVYGPVHEFWLTVQWNIVKS